MIIHIASGESAAGDLRFRGCKNVYAFNEAMCEGEAVLPLGGPEFCRKREEAYNLKSGEYVFFGDKLKDVLPDTRRIELYFDYDMFCAVNTITLLAYLEEYEYFGEINFNLIEQDGTADIIRSFPIKLGEFKNIYKTALIDRKPCKTGAEHIDKGVGLYLEYKSGKNKITDYIQENNSVERKSLCVDIMNKFPEYGLGDISIFNLIDINKGE